MKDAKSQFQFTIASLYIFGMYIIDRLLSYGYSNIREYECVPVISNLLWIVQSSPFKSSMNMVFMSFLFY